jgi:hypothetical protein
MTRRTLGTVQTRAPRIPGSVQQNRSEPPPDLARFNQGAEASKPEATPLIIRFHLVDGAVESFVQEDAAVAGRLWESVEPQRLFDQARLIVADRHSKTVYVSERVNRVDFIGIHQRRWCFPGCFPDVVEITEAEFCERTRGDDGSSTEQPEQRHRATFPLTFFIDLRFLGNTRVLLMVEGLVKLPIESHLYMNFLLSKGWAHTRLRGGGASVLNLTNLVSYSVHPDAMTLPEEVWMLSRLGRDRKDAGEESKSSVVMTENK